jgi:hypothetical protein
MSSFSFLELLEEQLRWEADSLIEGGTPPKAAYRARNIFETLEPSDDKESEFSRDPLGLLSRLGAHIGGRRHVRSLYRVRVYSAGPAIFAYPIFVSEVTD